jgi:hypothetical protein
MVGAPQFAFMTNNDQNKKNHGHFPPDLAAMLSFPLFTGSFLFVCCSLSWAATFGDRSLFDFAVFLGSIGVVLLLLAKIPLYGERRFFTVGPGAMKGRHQKLYFAAYAFIVPAVVLLILLCAALK